MKRMQTLYYIIMLPALVLHEISHAVMAIILNQHFMGIKISAFLDEDNRIDARGTVYHRGGSKWVCILISAAPSIFWVVLFLLSSATGHLLVTIYLSVFAGCCNVSKHDVENIKAQIKGLPNGYSTTEDSFKLFANKSFENIKSDHDYKP